MKAMILYWSVTGTTRRVAEAIAEGIRAESAECDLHDLREGAADSLADYDVIGIGSPVHFYRTPEPVVAAIDALAPLNGRPTFVFMLHATYRGAGLNRTRAALTRAGATEVGVFACYGEGRFIGYSREGYQFSPGHPTPADLTAASAFGSGVVRAVAARNAGEPPRAMPPADPPTHAVYAIERALVGKWLTRTVYSRLFRADADLCTRCGRCVRACPTGNITMRRGERPAWGRDCVACGTCAEVCPESAVRTPYDWPVFTPFMRYNVRRAARDPELDRRRVQLTRGTLVPVGEDERDGESAGQ